jgi:virginiamycin B lyase
MSFRCGRSIWRASRVLAAIAGLVVSAGALAQAPTLTRLVPAFGPAGGNNIVVIAGTGFQAGATVTFGGVPASSVMVNNATALTAKPPAHAAGPVTVAVTNPNAQSGNLASGYKYLVPAGATGFQYFPITGNGIVTDVTAGPDGNLWFLTNGGESLDPDGLAKMTPAGTFTPYPLADPGLLVDIAPGLDGNLWYLRAREPFTADPDKVGRLTPQGVTTEYPLSGGKKVGGITAGPDGATWFTEYNAATVGRITSAGAITEFPIITNPIGITLGPDGQLWLAGCAASSGNSGVCGRFSTGGQLMSFPVPNPEGGVCPRRIVAATDGNLWFQYQGRNVVGRVTPAGVYAEFPLPSAEEVWDIAAGIDGNLWVTYDDFTFGFVARVTPQGAVTEFPLPLFSTPRGITSGPDGALWFTNGANVGRINPGAPPPTAPTSFYTVTPCRVLDTRDPNGPFGGPAIAAGVTRTFAIVGRCGIPASARAVSANLIVTQGASAGYVAAFAGGTLAPLAASLNYRPGQTRANNAIVPLGAAGDVAILSGQASGTVQVILDVNGYFQ